MLPQLRLDFEGLVYRCQLYYMEMATALMEAVRKELDRPSVFVNMH